MKINKEIERILSSILNFYSVEKPEIFSNSRKKHIVNARQIFIYCLRKKFKLSFPAIAKFLNKDHTTILHSCNRAKELINNKEQLKERVSLILGNKIMLEENFRYTAMPKCKEKILEENFRYTPIPKCKKEIIEYKFPIRFDKNYLKNTLFNLKKRNQYFFIKRYGLMNKNITTLGNIAVEKNLTRERIRQIINKTIRNLYINNYGGVGQIVQFIANKIIQDRIILTESLIDEFFIVNSKYKKDSIRFLLAILSIITWIEEFEISQRRFLINTYDKNNIFREIDKIKISFKKNKSTIPNYILPRNRKIFLLEKIKSDNYSKNDKNSLFLNDNFVKSCYDNYLFESKIIIYEKETFEKYNRPHLRRSKKIKGVPEEYNIFFR